MRTAHARAVRAGARAYMDIVDTVVRSRGGRTGWRWRDTGARTRLRNDQSFVACRSYVCANIKVSDIGARTHINGDYADQPRFAPIKAARRALLIAAADDNPTGAQILSVMKRCGDMLHVVCVCVILLCQCETEHRADEHNTDKPPCERRHQRDRRSNTDERVYD